MDAKELRIGNWVTDPDGYNKVIHIEEDCYYTESFKNTFAEINSIPLTEDILLKCGFESVNGTIRKDFTTFLEVCKFQHEEYPSLQTIKSGFKESKPIKYLHELQNLYYSLTKTELNIEL